MVTALIAGLAAGGGGFGRLGADGREGDAFDGGGLAGAGLAGEGRGGGFLGFSSVGWEDGSMNSFSS